MVALRLCCARFVQEPVFAANAGKLSSVEFKSFLLAVYIEADFYV